MAQRESGSSPVESRACIVVPNLAMTARPLLRSSTPYECSAADVHIVVKVLWKVTRA